MGGGSGMREEKVGWKRKWDGEEEVGWEVGKKVKCRGRGNTLPLTSPPENGLFKKDPTFNLFSMAFKLTTHKIHLLPHSLITLTLTKLTATLNILRILAQPGLMLACLFVGCSLESYHNLTTKQNQK
jgi:hypothetical protein